MNHVHCEHLHYILISLGDNITNIAQIRNLRKTNEMSFPNSLSATLMIHETLGSVVNLNRAALYPQDTRVSGPGGRMI